MGIINKLAEMEGEPAEVTFEVTLRVTETDYNAAKLILYMLHTLEGKTTYAEVERAFLVKWFQTAMDKGIYHPEVQTLWEALFWYRLVTSGPMPEAS